MVSIRVGVSDTGRRCGETHHRAKLSDHDVDLMRELAEDTLLEDGTILPGLSYGQLAEKFEVSRGTAFDIVKCRRRYAIALKYKIVHVPDDAHNQAENTRHETNT